jgi:RNA polymerase sigma factor (sigma-70 family)
MSNLLSDERLVRRAAGGEERAFAAIFDRYHQPLYRYCAAIVGNSQDAQDALQNTMLKVLRALPGEGREIKLKPWLYRIAHNESIDLLRRRRDTRELGAELVAPGPPLVDELSSRERLRQLLSDLDELPERQRGALVMRELAGLDFAGIATALGTSPAVARQTLYEARLSLHQMDEGRGMDCATVTQALSDGDGRVTRRRDVRAHLRSCSYCQCFRSEIETRERSFAGLAPLPAAAAAGLLHGLLGGGAASGGGGSAAGAAVAGGAAKTLGSSAALKSAAAVLAVAAIGTGAADRGGLIDLGLLGGGNPKAQSSRPPANSSHAVSAVAPAEAKRATGGAPTGTDRSGGTAHPTGPTDLTPQQPVSQPNGGETKPATHHVSAPPSAAVPPAARNNHASAEHGNGAEAKAKEPASSQGKASEHPHGKGHEKQLPAAAAHGQETAAAHKNAEHGASGEPPGQAAKPAHPAHPEHPAHPSNGKEKDAASESASESPLAEGTTTTEETAPPRGGGKKP